MFRFLKRPFAEHAFSWFLFSVFLSSKLCFFVSSWNVDPSCLDYKGQNIWEEICYAIDEAFDLATMGFAQAHTGHPSTIHLKSALFGSDQTRYLQAAGPLVQVPNLLYTLDFKVICDDLMVKLETSSNGEVEWVDDDHRWSSSLARFNPCDPTRNPNNPSTVRKEAYTLFGHLIYLCPVILDNPKGRLLRPYKDLDLLGSFFEEYVLLPVALLHELLRSDHNPSPLFDQMVEDYPPPGFFDRTPYRPPNMPLVPAFGWPLCWKLGQDHPDLAVRNCNSMALYALGLYLDNNDWAYPGQLPGLAGPLE